MGQSDRSPEPRVEWPSRTVAGWLLKSECQSRGAHEGTRQHQGRGSEHQKMRPDQLTLRLNINNEQCQASGRVEKVTCAKTPRPVTSCHMSAPRTTDPRGQSGGSGWEAGAGSGRRLLGKEHRGVSAPAPSESRLIYLAHALSPALATNLHTSIWFPASKTREL